jgi:SAM-dependent methyltransferase
MNIIIQGNLCASRGARVEARGSPMYEEPSHFSAFADSHKELDRLRLLEHEYDPSTIRHLTDLGVGHGWQCLEVGPGAGSVARWLGERVGRTGRVVGADIDPRFLGELDAPNIEVRRLDILRDELDAAAYDSAHCRFLLMHMADPEAVLRRMISALRPGGWILVEEPDHVSVEAVDDKHRLAELFNTAFRNRIRLLADAGIMDLRMGRSLPALMANVGLVDVANEGVARIARGGDTTSLVQVQTWAAIDDRLLRDGLFSEAESASTRHALEDPTFLYREQLMQAAWGRRPA